MLTGHVGRTADDALLEFFWLGNCGHMHIKQAKKGLKRGRL
jgi:hypothetical protein